MRDLEKYRGIIPAFYACYEDDGSVAYAVNLLKNLSM